MILQGIITEESGELFKLEKSLALHKRQVRARVVLRGLRQVVIYSYQLSPLSRSMRIEKTLWCMELRFWLTGMTRQIKQCLLAYDHFFLTNSADKSATTLIQEIESAEPSNNMFISVWLPGEVSSKRGNGHLICIMEEVTGFVDDAPLKG